MNVIFNIWDKNTSDKHSLLAICWNGIWQLALAIALSLVGAAFLSAILTDSRFLLEIDIYRGVKLTFILPVMLTAVLFMKRYDLLQVVGKGLKTLWERLNGLLDYLPPCSSACGTAVYCLLFCWPQRSHRWCACTGN
jgi:ABC-type Fe3+ transport system permease subunit